jgi:two-component system, chemotaxis family, response regulator Rcp1
MPTSTQKTSRSINVLVVKDNMADAVLIHEALKVHSRFMRLTVARDGKEAVAYLNRVEDFNSHDRPDLILLDLSAPQRSGVALLAEIRADAALNEMPAIALTDSQSDRDLRRTYDSNANFFIKKPDSLDELFLAIHHIADLWFKGIRQ